MKEQAIRDSVSIVCWRSNRLSGGVTSTFYPKTFTVVMDPLEVLSRLQSSADIPVCRFAGFPACYREQLKTRSLLKTEIRPLE
jgi:hypothetical protein